MPEPLIDEFVKSRDSHFFVIPAKAGIQFFQIVINPLDTGFHRCDDFLRDHLNCAIFINLVVGQPFRVASDVLPAAGLKPLKEAEKLCWSFNDKVGSGMAERLFCFLPISMTAKKTDRKHV